MSKDPRRPYRMPPSTTPGRHPGGRTCVTTLAVLTLGPWLADLLLAASSTAI